MTEWKALQALKTMRHMLRRAEYAKFYLDCYASTSDVEIPLAVSPLLADDSIARSLLFSTLTAASASSFSPASSSAFSAFI